MTADTRRKIIRWATIIVIIFAYGFSYSHGVELALASLPEDQPAAPLYGFGLAAIPEVCFVMAVLRAQENPQDVRVYVIGILSFAWMIWANASGAGEGAAGMIVALLAPGAALLMLWVNGHPTQEPEPTKETATRVTIERQTRTARPATQKPPTVTAVVVQDQKPPVTQEPKALPARPSDQLASAVDWIKAQPGYAERLPSRPAIVTGAGVSDSTAKRARAAVRAELGQE